MGPTCYEMEKLMRLTHDQKISSTMKRKEVRQLKIAKDHTDSEQMVCCVRPSGAVAK